MNLPDLETFVDSVPVPLVVISVEGGFKAELANPFYEMLLQRKVQGLRIDEYLSPEELKINQPLLDTFRNIQKTKLPETFRAQPFQFHHLDEPNYIDLIFFPVMNAKGTVTHIVALGPDVTESVQQAESLRAERDVRDMFVSGFGHDVNQCLTVVRVALEAIEKEIEDAKLKAIAGHGLNAVSQTESMIRSLLDTYYMSSMSDKSLNLREFHPGEVIRTYVDLLSFKHGRRFRFKVTENFSVKWDREAFTRILDNLVSNAIKYSPDEALITISLLSGKKSARLSVKNEGSFISKEDQKKIFGMYQRGKSSHGIKGWGLGLSIVKMLAEAHGGTVEVSSSVEDGTTFYVEFPKKVKLS